MGGDFAPGPIVDGVGRGRARHPDLGAILVGADGPHRGRACAYPDAARWPIDDVDAPEVVGMNEAPAAALRRKPGASIRVAVQQVADGHASAVVSAGQHRRDRDGGAHRARVDPGVDRPALAAVIPTKSARAVLLDVGANAECRPAHLVQFGVMGAVFAQIALGWSGRASGCCRLARRSPRATS